MSEPSRSRTGIAFIHNPMRAYREQGMTSDTPEKTLMQLLREQGPFKRSRKPRRSHKLKRRGCV